jgi:hypothetical protein
VILVKFDQKVPVQFWCTFLGVFGLVEITSLDSKEVGWYGLRILGYVLTCEVRDVRVEGCKSE